MNKAKIDISIEEAKPEETSILIKEVVKNSLKTLNF